jgi:hypothetical protein
MKERKPIDPELRRYLDELARQAAGAPVVVHDTFISDSNL